MIGAVQGASCFGPAYEYALMVVSDLRKRRIRDQVPITFVTSEPYIGHLGLGGVGDTKGMLKSVMRDRDIKWITNAKIDRVNANSVEATELNEEGSVKKAHKIATNLRCCCRRSAASIASRTKTGSGSRALPIRADLSPSTASSAMPNIRMSSPLASASLCRLSRRLRFPSECRKPAI